MPSNDDGLAKDDDDDLLREVQSLVNKQYDLTVSFCNAQTSLLNGVTPTWQPVASAAATTTTPIGHDDRDARHEILLDDYAACLRKVQDHWTQLQNINNRMREIPAYRRIWTVFKAHRERTERVLLTVQRAGGGVWTSHGLSLSTNDSGTVTVALATLRASVDSVREVLTLYLSKE